MIAFTVYGTPAPQGSKRHVGGGVMIESSKKVKPWRQDVKYAALEAINGIDGLPIDGPIRINITFTLARPKSAKKGATPCKKPDIDKLIRSTFDAIGEAGIWADDARVISVLAEKIYVGDPHALSSPGAIIGLSEIRP